MGGYVTCDHIRLHDSCNVPTASFGYRLRSVKLTVTLPFPVGNRAQQAKSRWGLLLIIATLAFALRAYTGLSMSESDYWDLGYFEYLPIARNFSAGHGLCLAASIFIPERLCSSGTALLFIGFHGTRRVEDRIPIPSFHGRVPRSGNLDMRVLHRTASLQRLS